jgi:hypothetical protein
MWTVRSPFIAVMDALISCGSEVAKQTPSHHRRNRHDNQSTMKMMQIISSNIRGLCSTILCYLIPELMVYSALCDDENCPVSEGKNQNFWNMGSLPSGQFNTHCDCDMQRLQEYHGPVSNLNLKMPSTTMTQHHYTL